METWLIENTVVTLALVGLVSVAGLGLRNRPAIRHALWLIVLLKLVTPSVVSWTQLAPAAQVEVIGLYERHLQPMVEFVVAQPPTQPSLAFTNTVAEASTPVLGTLPSPPHATTAATERAFPTPALLLTCWSVGSGILLLGLFRRQRRVSLLLRERQSAPDWLREDVARLSAELRIAAVPLVVLPGLAAPCAGGLFRTRVFWPAMLTDPQRRRDFQPLLAHELAHLHRWDHVTARFELLAGLFYWWHPLFWFLRSRLREAAEQACDSRALELCPVAPRAYAESLLALQSGDVLPLAAASLRGHGRRVLQRRLVAVMRGARSAELPAWTRVAAAALLLLALPSWSASPHAGPPAQDPQPATAPPAAAVASAVSQDPAPSAEGHIGRVRHLIEQVATVELRGDVAAKTGDHFWIGKGMWRFVVKQLDGRIAFGRLIEKDNDIAVGDLVWRQPASLPAGSFRARVEHVAGRIATLRVLDGAVINRGDSLVLFDHTRERAQARVRLVEDGNAFVRLVPDITLTVGSVVRLGAVQQPGQARAARNGLLGGPLARPAGGAGHTWIADYSDNRIVELDATGATVSVLDEIYGVWDVEPLAGGNLLLTEFSVSRVIEVDAAGKVVWSFEDLRNPYDADRLPNGNTLIADTFRDQVIEVDRAGKIVWVYAEGSIRPFDVERLSNGNTLIADVNNDRVLEVSRAGELVWEVRGLPSVHDADRLDNGNTLVTLRRANKVVEIDPDGKVIATIEGLNAPSDADRLPSGHTLVAENKAVREFDTNGKLVWRAEMTWAVEVSRR